jgi:mRNA (guanine-N7-)-methyltransferase
MASDYGLECVYREEFHQVFNEHQDHPEFRPLMLRMGVMDDQGESAMDEDQWEAASESFLLACWITASFSFA